MWANRSGINIRLVQFRYTACLNLVVSMEESCLNLDRAGFKIASLFFREKAREV